MALHARQDPKEATNGAGHRCTKSQCRAVVGTVAGIEKRSNTVPSFHPFLPSWLPKRRSPTPAFGKATRSGFTNAKADGRLQRLLRRGGYPSAQTSACHTLGCRTARRVVDRRNGGTATPAPLLRARSRGLQRRPQLSGTRQCIAF